MSLRRRLAEFGFESNDDYTFQIDCLMRAEIAHLRTLHIAGESGNVRELENSIERAVALCEGSQIMAHDLPPQLREKRREDIVSFALSRNMTLEELEREYILRVMKEESGNKTRAAQRLGLDRKTLYRKLEEAGRAATGDGDGDGESDDGTADDHD